MISQFENLREDDVRLMYKVPVYVTILIAGADGKIDKKELQEAVTITNLKKIKSRKLMAEYYREVGETFEQELKKEIEALPSNAEERNAMIIEKLERLNIVWHYIDNKFAIQFYESMKDLAKKVAQASGGVLGFLSVGHEESKFIELKMVRNPIRLQKKK